MLSMEVVGLFALIAIIPIANLGIILIDLNTLSRRRQKPKKISLNGLRMLKVRTVTLVEITILSVMWKDKITSVNLVNPCGFMMKVVPKVKVTIVFITYLGTKNCISIMPKQRIKRFSNQKFLLITISTKLLATTWF